MKRRNLISQSTASLAALLVGQTGLLAQEEPAQDVSERLSRLEAENVELQRRIDVLAEEQERLELGELVPTMGESEHGLGPAASKIYNVEQGLSFGGYGEALFQDFAGPTRRDQFDFLRAVFYFGYRFNERWLFNSEIEFEHAAVSEGGDTSVEFAYLDYLWRPAVNFRAGILLTPMGFINELHEPPTFLGATRPGDRAPHHSDDLARERLRGLR